MGKTLIALLKDKVVSDPQKRSPLMFETGNGERATPIKVISYFDFTRTCPQPPVPYKA